MIVGHEVSIKIDRAFKAKIKATWVEKIVKRILIMACIDGIVELSIVFTDNEKIQDLNKRYRNMDNPTDVLAFQMHSDDQNGKIAFITPPDNIHHLGEVVISYPQAVRQARDYGHDITHEVKILLIHGILHLLGYDHRLSAEEEIMRSKETEILEKLAVFDD